MKSLDPVIRILDAEIESYCSRNGIDAWQTLKAHCTQPTASNSSSTKLADDIECAKQWLLPQRPVTQVEVDACIVELDILISQLRAS